MNRLWVRLVLYGTLLGVIFVGLGAKCFGSDSKHRVGSSAPPWTVQLGTTVEDVAYGVAIDTSGAVTNVYVVGYTYGDLGDVITNTGGYDLFLVKYDTDGVKQWARQLGTADEDLAYGVATDTNGNIYVAGGTLGDLGDVNPNAGRYDLFVVKYNPAGVKQWTRQLGSSADDGAFGVATDTNGKIYVAGNRGFDVYVVKYSPTGAKKWARKFGTPGWDYAWGIAIDTSNNIYAAGLTYGDLGDVNPNAGGWDLFVVKYNSTGTKQWTRQLGTAETDKAFGVATDTSGNVYAVGETKGNLDGNPNAGGFDLFVVKYNPAGVKQWTRQLGTAGEDWAYSVAIDTSGAVTNVYVAGWTSGGLDGNPNAGGRDIFVVKYNSAGVKQ